MRKNRMDSSRQESERGKERRRRSRGECGAIKTGRRRSNELDVTSVTRVEEMKGMVSINSSQKWLRNSWFGGA